MNMIKEWEVSSAQNKKEFAQEGLILDVTEQIWEKMVKLGLKKQNLAERLGCGKSYVTQLMNGSRNMTLRTLSDVAMALECDIKIDLVEKNSVADLGKWFVGRTHINVANQSTHTETVAAKSNIIPLVTKVSPIKDLAEMYG